MCPASRCVILVPVGGTIDPGCEASLRELERRGYPVWRVRGYAAIDAAGLRKRRVALLLPRPERYARYRYRRIVEASWLSDDSAKRR